MVDLEISLAKTFGWSLADMDETDTAGLLDFVFRAAQTRGKPPAPRKYCDQADWL